MVAAHPVCWPKYSFLVFCRIFFFLHCCDAKRETMAGLSKKVTCLQGRVAEWLRGRVAEINFGRCLPMSTKLAAAANRGRPP